MTTKELIAVLKRKYERAVVSGDICITIKTLTSAVPKIIQTLEALDDTLIDVMRYLGPNASCNECAGCQTEMASTLDAVHKCVGKERMVEIYKDVLGYRYQEALQRFKELSNVDKEGE